MLLPSAGLLTRRVFASLALSSLAAVAPRSSGAAVAEAPRATATSRASFDLVIARSDGSGETRLDDPEPPVRGSLEFDLFGDAAPATAKAFAEYAGGSDPGYGQSQFYARTQDGVLLGGRIAGVRSVQLFGSPAMQYGERVLPSVAFETNGLKHDRRGLLTRSLAGGFPEFGITLGPTPALDDGAHVVFGAVSGAGSEALLRELEALPVLTERSTSTGLADAWFVSQKKLFTEVANTVGDTRALKVYPGRLLRRVSVTQSKAS